MWNAKGSNNSGGFLLLGHGLWHFFFLFCFILPQKIKNVQTFPNFIYSIYIQVGKMESAYVQ